MVIVTLAAIVVVGALLRFLPAATHDWPYRDGGLFFAMIGDILANGFVLPETTSYQGGVIPFAYPPLAFYLAAGLELFTGMERADVLRLLPPFVSVLCIPAMYLVAREAAPSTRHALLATTFYVALAGLTDVLIAGGGLTRAMGFLFALVAAWQGFRMYATGRWRNVAATAIVAGLAVLSHPEAGVFIAVALGSALLFHRTLRSLLQTITAAVGALLIASPWLVTVIARHGVAPFLSALAVPRRDLFDSVIAYVFLFLIAAPAVGLLDIAGQVRQARRRQPQLIVWRVGVFAFDLRYSPIAGGPPVSILAAIGALDVLAPLSSLVLRAAHSRGRLHRIAAEPLRRSVIGLVVVLAFVPAVRAVASYTEPQGAITAADRQAMAWIRDHTDPSTRVVTLATDQWGSDLVSEWMPAISGRVSLTTSQGLEWAARDIRSAQEAAESDLRTCMGADAACIASWLSRHDPDGRAVIFVAGPASAGSIGHACCAEIRAALAGSELFQVLSEDAGGTILRRSASPLE